jgi:hypothetical protein
MPFDGYTGAEQKEHVWELSAPVFADMVTRPLMMGSLLQFSLCRPLPFCVLSVGWCGCRGWLKVRKKFVLPLPRVQKSPALRHPIGDLRSSVMFLRTQIRPHCRHLRSMTSPSLASPQNYPTPSQSTPEKTSMSGWAIVLGLGAAAFFVCLPHHRPSETEEVTER